MCLPEDQQEHWQNDKVESSRKRKDMFLEDLTLPAASSQQQSGDSWGDFEDLSEIPAPSNTPTDENPDLEPPLFLPRQFWSLTDRPGIDLCSANGADLVRHFTQLYVILFGVGTGVQTEGIYSLRAVSEEGLPLETIIVFEDQEDATRYAALLEAAMDHIPMVCNIRPDELLDFCAESGYECRMEPRGSLLIPPNVNVTTTDWERSMRLRDGRWAVLETEPELQESSATTTSSTRTSSTSSVTQQQQQQQQQLQQHLPVAPTGSGAHLARYHPSMTDDELSKMRVKLEALLPASAESPEH